MAQVARGTRSRRERKASSKNRFCRNTQSTYFHVHTCTTTQRACRTTTVKAIIRTLISTSTLRKSKAGDCTVDHTHARVHATPGGIFNGFALTPQKKCTPCVGNARNGGGARSHASARLLAAALLLPTRLDARPRATHTAPHGDRAASQARCVLRLPALSLSRISRTTTGPYTRAQPSAARMGSIRQTWRPRSSSAPAPCCATS